MKRSITRWLLCAAILGTLLGAAAPAQAAGDCAGLPQKWENVARWRPEIQAAQRQVTAELGVLVPTHVVMAIIMIETGGIMPDGPTTAGAVGLMHVSPFGFGADRHDIDRAARDPAYSIYLGITDLALRSLDSAQYNFDHPGQPLPWENVVVGYFSGHYFPNGASDGYFSDLDYQQAFVALFDELEATDSCDAGTPIASPAATSDAWLSAVGTSIAGLSAIWGGDDAALTQEFGPTDFSTRQHPDWFAYVLEYGFPEIGHPGLDVGLPLGSPLYAPVDAVVSCAGTGNPGFPDEESCPAFAGPDGGPTSGRLQLKLPNGDMLILGHVEDTVVAPGAKVSAGQLIGHSGGGAEGGDYVHIEYRVADPSLPAGWRIIDPRLTPLNGLPVPPIAATEAPDETPAALC